MKKIIYALFVFVILSCNESKKSESKKQPLTVAQQIANAHGYSNWKNVSEISFTFNEKRGWTWNPKSNNVVLRTLADTISYNRKQIDSSLTRIDKGFINDKFWLLIPFQLIWDKGITISNPSQLKAPISKTRINKITITYPDKGGYTPGDAYDIYYDDNFIIKEWGFRKGNEPQARIINTFENYKDFDGIKIALNHKNMDGRPIVGFTKVDIKVSNSE
ncbi:hypothetical protein [Hyunsoonleella aestuarii]|uniref:Uncharacterized protein n=1 Tax=Hyunsoonleella aestuarii TaxID=912802 RepID=A0ABP8EF12_9FLAO|nr:hypothetical protein [Hyunsoonleella aestuarii]